LAAGNGDGLAKAGFSGFVRHKLSGCWRTRFGLEEEFSLEAMQLCFPPAFAGVVHLRQGLGQHLQSSLGLCRRPIGFGQQGEESRQSDLGSGGARGFQALAHLGNTRFSVSLDGHSPSPKEPAPGQPERKVPLLSEG
jgi:hypothetical protein